MSENKQIHIYRHLISAFLAGLLLAALFSQAFVGLLFRNFGPGYAESLRHAGKVASWGELLASLAAIVFWFRPLARFLSGGRKDLRLEAIRRFNSIYIFFICLAAANFALEILFSVALGYGLPPAWGAKDLFLTVLIPNLFVNYYVVYFAVLYLEPFVFEKVALRLYEGDEIYRGKTGLRFGVRTRLLLMVSSLALVPMAILGANIYILDLQTGKWDMLVLIAVALACLAGYSEMLYRGITKPLSELARKMGRLSEGDFNVRTSVLSDDEIGTMKAHFNEMVSAMEERERLRDTFGKYVSIEIAKQLMSSGKVQLGGDSIKATILFSDIRDFTPLSGRMGPQELVSFLNDYFSHIVEPITANRGVVNKFIGDAVMAIFAPQFGSESHVDDALRAALGMRAMLEKFNAKRPAASRIKFGVGLHTGVLVAGNIGTEQRLEYTVIGDTVNVASRIESANKDLSSTILISEDVYKALSAEVRSSVKLEKCEDISLKGKEHSVTLYRAD